MIKNLRRTDNTDIITDFIISGLDYYPLHHYKCICVQKQTKMLTISALFFQTVFEFVLAFNSIVHDLPQWKCWKTADYKEGGDKRFVLSLFYELFAKGNLI